MRVTSCSTALALWIALVLCCLALPGAYADTVDGSGPPALRDTACLAREEPFAIREFRPYIGERWIGNAVAYGPYRDGQFPGGPAPSKEELREDLHLMAGHWGLLRLYASGGPARTVLQIIAEDDLDIRVMLGVWIGAEEQLDAEGRLALP